MGKDKRNRIARVVGMISALCLAFFCFLPVAPSVAETADTGGIIVMDKARFTVIAPNCIRLEYSENGNFIDAPSLFAVNRFAAFKEFKLTKEAGSTTIDTGQIRLVFTPDGKPFSAGNLKAHIKKGDGEVEWKPGMKNPGNLGGTIRTVDGVFGPVDLGEGLLSRDGWYLLDDSRNNLYTVDWVMSRPSDAGTDWYLFGYGNDYLSALRSLAVIGGPVPLPRKYALGAWYSRYWAYTSKEFRELVQEYKEHDFPLDIIVMDMDWHRDGWTGWSWNRTLLPDAEELLKWFHEQGLAVTLNLHPADGVGPHEDAYVEFMKAMGKDPATRETLIYDAGDKKYIDNLFKYTHAPLEAEGVDFWWLDWQQYPYTRSIEDLTNLAWLNNYYYNWTARNGKRGQSFSRWPGWGDHRHPIHFSGDAGTNWPMLAFEVPFTSTAGNVGTFFWSHDIGGHMGARIPESYTRWVQFGAMSAALRSHSTKNADLDRRPWKYPKWAEDSMRISFHLRSVLFPYIYSSAWVSHRDTVPLNRPMYLFYPELEEAYRNPQQYFYGDAFLVAPVVSPGVGDGLVSTQVVWFPEGVWYNWFTGEKFQGPVEILASADINEFPLYARAGVPIPLQPYTQRMATEPLNELVVRCYPGADGQTGTFTLYEDDGITNDYMQDRYALTDLACKRQGDTITVTVGPVRGAYNGKVMERSYVIELPFASRAVSAQVDGKAATVEFSDEELINRVKVPGRSIDRGVEVQFKAGADNPEIFKTRAAERRLRGLLGDSARGLTPRQAAIKLVDEKADPALLKAVLAVGGFGAFGKNEALYLYKGTKEPYFYSAMGFIDDDYFTLTVQDRFGTETKTVYNQLFRSLGWPAGLPPLEEMAPGAGFGIRAIRVLRAEFKILGKPVAVEEIIGGKNNYLKKWQVIGPFDFDTGKSMTDQKFEPETGVVDLSAAYQGSGGKTVKWHKAQVADNNAVNLQRQFMFDQDNKIAYAAAFIDSPREQEAVFNLNSDDGAEMWLNGQSLLSKPVSRGFDQDPDVIKGMLKQGRNIILLKISQFGGDWLYRMTIDTTYPVEETSGRK